MVTRRLDIVIKQIDTLCSLYTDVLTCRAPAKNYALFLMEEYLQLKINVVKVGAPIEINIVDDFINCCKHYGVKVQRLFYEFYLHNLVLYQETEQNPSPSLGISNCRHSFAFGVNQINGLRPIMPSKDKKTD